MDFEQESSSCWGAAKWTLVLCLGLLAVVWLFGGFEPSAVASQIAAQ
ncbi:MAG: hypothetical protein KDI98_03385 [Hyphomicrobiaceae bacterium]|nr:hypothetical protein [Hyphomicrobiaceae bacterium]